MSELVREDGVHEIWEDIPCGKSLTRQYWQGGVKFRQDIEIHVRPGLFTLMDLQEWQVHDLKLTDGAKKVVNATVHVQASPPIEGKLHLVKE